MKYNEEKLQECEDWISENGLIEFGGASLVEFLCAMDIKRTTFYRWKSEKKDFWDTIKKGRENFKESLEQRIVKSISKAAIGYDWEQKTTEYTNENGHKVIRKQTVRTMRETPNVGAAIFLLTNLNPVQWKNSQAHELSGEVSSGLKIVVENDEEKQLIEELGNLR